MASIPLVAHPAPVSTFDPADWLSRFKDVGGWWIVTAGGKVTLGWMLDGFTEAQNEAARARWGELSISDRKATVTAHVRALAGEVCHD